MSEEEIQFPRDVEVSIKIPRDQGFIVSEIMPDGERVLLAGLSESAEVAGWVSKNLRHYDKPHPTFQALDDDGDWMLPRMFQQLANVVTRRLAK